MVKKIFLFVLLINSLFSIVYAQTDSITSYTKKSYMIPMRDGVKLFTVVLTPTQQIRPNPFLLERTPYGADIPLDENAIIPVAKMGGLQAYAKEGYIARFTTLCSFIEFYPPM